jgi:hypothetical protein
MADDLSKTGKQDVSRINVNQPHEVNYRKHTKEFSRIQYRFFTRLCIRLNPIILKFSTLKMFRIVNASIHVCDHHFGILALYSCPRR